ncbi:hypothetical protein Tco_0572451 [Tanacetum coccineum]
MLTHLVHFLSCCCFETFRNENLLSSDESNTYVLERFNTSAGNPVKNLFLLKLNLSDHRLFKMVVEVPDSSWLT